MSLHQVKDAIQTKPTTEGAGVRLQRRSAWHTTI